MEVGDDWVQLSDEEVDEFGVPPQKIIINKKRNEPDWLIQHVLWYGYNILLKDCYVPEFREFCKIFNLDKLLVIKTELTTTEKETADKLTKFQLKCNLKRIDDED